MIKAIFSINTKGFMGKNNNLIVKDKEDLGNFKKITENHTIVMGRKTWESLGNKPLPNRNNVILSESLESKTILEESGYYTHFVNSGKEVQDILDEDKENNRDTFIIGGSSILELFSDLIDEWIVSLFYTNSEIGDTKLGLSASKYFEESIPFNSVKFKNFDVIYTKKNLDPRIFLFYDSMTGNTERFVKKVAKVLIEDLKKDVYVIKIDDNSLLGSNERGHLVTWTNGYVKDGKDEKKRIPHRTLNFVKNNKNNILTVSSTGQKNWGKNDFGSAVDTINENYGIKKGLKVELSGNKEEVQKYVEMIKEIYEQEVYDIEQQSKYKRF